jgi:hypothetical protein
MAGAGHQFLARAGLAADQDGGDGGGVGGFVLYQHLDQFAQGLDGTRLAQDAFDAAVFGIAALVVVERAPGVGFHQGPVDHVLQGLERDRLGEQVEGARFHGVDRDRHVRVARHHHGAHLVVVAVQFADHFEPVDPGQLVVHDRHIGHETAGRLQARDAIAGDLHRVVVLLEEACDVLRQHRLVFDDQ